MKSLGTRSLFERIDEMEVVGELKWGGGRRQEFLFKSEHVLNFTFLVIYL